MTFDVVDVLGLTLALLGLVSIFRRRDRGGSGTPAGRMREIFTSRRDTPASRQHVKELMAQEYGEEEARRTKLWEEAASSLRAARQLQRAIQGDLEANDYIRRYVAEHRPDDNAGAQDLNLRRREIEQELERVAGLIRHLRA